MIDKTILSEGNIKLGKILNVNLPPVVTCSRDVPCSTNGCYALKSFKQYPNVRKAWESNLELYNCNSTKYFESIIDQIKRKRKLPKRFRWHSSGDIVD